MFKKLLSSFFVFLSRSAVPGELAERRAGAYIGTKMVQIFCMKILEILTGSSRTILQKSLAMYPTKTGRFPNFPRSLTNLQKTKIQTYKAKIFSAAILSVNVQASNLLYYTAQ